MPKRSRKRSARTAANVESDNLASGDHEAALVLAHIVWALGALAVTWTVEVWIGLTTFRLTSVGFLKDLTYSATIVHGLWMLGLLLVVLHLALHFYQKYAALDERFPGQLGKLVIPQALRWLRVIIFIAIVVAPTGAYACFFLPRMFGLSIVHRDGQASDADTKRGFKLVSDWGTTHRPEGRSIFHGWRWHSWNDERKNYATSSNPTGVDAWPGLFPTLHGMLALSLVSSLGWLAWRPRRGRPRRLETHRQRLLRHIRGALTRPRRRR